MSASMSSPSLITLSLFGCFVQCFYLAMLFGSFIRCFHLAICASTLVTLIFILTLRVTSLDSRPKRQQSRPTSGSQGLKCEHIGGSKTFRGGPNTSVEFGPGVQLLQGSKYYVTGLTYTIMDTKAVGQSPTQHA